MTYRFDDPFLPGATVLPGLTKQLDVVRKDEGPGEKAELLFAKANLHLRQVPPQAVLPANLKRPGEVVQLGQKKNKKTKAQPSVSGILDRRTFDNFTFCLKVKTSWNKRNIYSCSPSGALRGS